MIGDGAELFKLNDYDGTPDNIKSYILIVKSAFKIFGYCNLATPDVFALIGIEYVNNHSLRCVIFRLVFPVKRLTRS